MLFKAFVTLALATVALGENCASAQAKADAALAKSGNPQIGDILVDDGQFSCVVNSAKAAVCSDNSGASC